MKAESSSRQIDVAISALLIALVILNLFAGSVSIPSREVLNILTGSETTNGAWNYIILQMRLPAALTALLTGAALGSAGLILQTYFRNALAGPSVLGITSGANLAVAISVLLLGQLSGYALIGAAMTGAFFVLSGLLAIAQIVRHNVTLLIVGILLSYLTSAILALLQYQSSAEGVQMMLIWGLGSFQQVGLSQLPIYAAFILSALIGSLWLIRPLNGWMLGETYAQNLGISIKGIRWGVLLITGVLCAVTTAWCGPISFIGLSMPHIARMLCHTDNHRTLLPVSMLLGACCSLLCLWLSNLPEGGRTLPINALTPLFGVPVILYVLFSSKK